MALPSVRVNVGIIGIFITLFGVGAWWLYVVNSFESTDNMQFDENQPIAQPVMTHQSGLKYHDHSLTELYENYNGEPGFDHWMQYGRKYDEHLKDLKPGPDFKMLEIGIQSGGSTRIWNSYWGNESRYIGMDINPACKQFESRKENIIVEIGSQLDPDFQKQLCAKYGPFDFIIDDGGHTTEMMVTSFEVLWSCLKDQGIYAIEDTHTMSTWKGDAGMLVNGKDIFGYMADIARGQSAYYKKGQEQTKEVQIADHIEYISIYDSLIFLKYQKDIQRNQRFKKGKFIPYARR